MSGEDDGTRRVVATSAGRLDAVIAALLPELSRSRVSKLVREGAVRVDGVVVDRPAASVQADAELEIVVPAARPAEAVAQDLPIVVVYEDDDLVVLDKAPGMVVHPGAGHADGTLVNALLHHVGGLSGIGGVERPGIVHRLDRGTSGLIVVAKHDAAHHALAAQFAAHTAFRTYLALTLAEPATEKGTVRSRLGRHPTDRLRFASTRSDQGKEAVTHWRVRGRGRGLALVECRLETGRTHQIRVHLTEQGWPLAGDPLYRGRGVRTPDWLAPLLPDDRPMLHAWQLELEHPRDGRRRRFVAPPPADFEAAAAAAGIGMPEPG